MARVFNFSAGPSVLPEPVLNRAAAELFEYRSTGQSVMEMSHRSPEFIEIAERCEALLREVMCIPKGFRVLFLQGGASTQFAMVPMNLMREGGVADYMVTGYFSGRAAEEAAKYGRVNVVASGKDCNFTRIPDLSGVAFDEDAAYLHICLNNTVFGTRFPQLPDAGNLPLVADLSSCILSEPIDVDKFALIYAGAQKNMAPAGLTVVIMREELAGRPLPCTPTMLDYAVQIKNDSMYNTPPCYSMYMCMLVLEWLRDDIGGLSEMQRLNRAKAARLYDYLDQSKLFRPTVSGEYRSMMNVTFVTGDAALDDAFVMEAQNQGMINLKGHRAVGGMRASIYNAMPQEGVARLVDFMSAFEKAHSK